MNGQQLARQLRTMDLNSPGDVQALAEKISEPTPDDVLPLLELCLGRKNDPTQQHYRCALMVQLTRECGDRRLFLPMTRALQHADDTLRTSLVRALPMVNDPKRHRELCALLRSRDRGVRLAASRLIVQLGGKPALDELHAMVRERNFEARAMALETAVRVGGHRAVPVLVDAMRVASRSEKGLIIRLLGDAEHMGAHRAPAMKALSGLLDDPDETTAIAAIGAFSRLAGEDQWFEHLAPALESSRPAVLRAAIGSLGGFDSPRTIATLQGKLRAGHKSVRFVVLDTLEAIGTNAVLPILVDALGHENLQVRSRAGEILGRLGATGKVDIARAVLWLLRSSDAQVRRMAVDVARQSKDPSAILWPRLFEFLRDEDWWVRERVADALIELAGGRLLRQVVTFFDDPSPPVRLFAVDVIRRLEMPEALGALVRCAQSDPDWLVREQAMFAIAELGDERAVPYLVHIVMGEPEVRLGGLEALKLLGSGRAAPHVAQLLTDPEADVRLSALECLEVIGSDDLAPAVRGVMSDPDGRVRDAARRLALNWKLRVGSVDEDGGLEGLDRMLMALAEAEGDDLLLQPGRTPHIKRLGLVEPIGDQVLDDEVVRALVLPILTGGQLEALEQGQDVDLSYEVQGKGVRFRANVFHQMHGLGAVFRIVKGEIPSLETLGLPDVVAGLGRLKNGLVLIGGPTGSGKSTTLAALIDDINATSSRHVVTLEDPIEVVHGQREGLVNQREIGTHTGSYSRALRATLREDPDVILIGEMRDLETIAFAVSAAETGHLVFGTVHTVAADTTLDRMINAFPATEQDQVRSMLAGSLRAVCCQYLLPRADAPGRVLACEVMFNNDAVAHLIRKGKCYQIPGVITTQREAGMQSMDGELMRLVQEGTISPEVAWVKARDKRDFEAFMNHGGPSDSRTAAAGA